MSKDPKRVLIDEATRLISDPMKWHTECCFRDENGDVLWFMDEGWKTAHSFCAFGALVKCAIDNKMSLSVSEGVCGDFREKYKEGMDTVNDMEGREAVISKLKGLYNE